ncbi:zinc-binding dehydrogenase [Saccharomonospora sp. NPDC046836]|uniref:zinc-binding dehydrogenase n=1 Tax=Saccharomonospora sp. NPDC046836 TaxID=3156921 RepID=UPI0033FDC019
MTSNDMTRNSTDESIQHRELTVENFGGPERLCLISTATPPAPAGHARVRVLAVGVGFTDCMARGGDYLLQRKRPFVPGYELVGEIVDYCADPGQPEPAWLAPGVRVAACLPKMGAYTEYRVLPIGMLVPVPDGLDTRTAAAIPLDYLTALSLLERHGHVRPGDAVLIHGATGGVGDALCQLGTLARLQMYGTASERSIARLDRYPITPINYRTHDIEHVVREHKPGGVQAVFDHLGTGMRANHRLLAVGGVLVSYAFVGRPGRIRTGTVLGAARNRLLGLWPGRRTAICSLPHEIRTDPAWYRDSLARLLDLAVRRAIEPTVGETYPLADASAAHAALESRTSKGKLLMVTD